MTTEKSSVRRRGETDKIFHIATCCLFVLTALPAGSQGQAEPTFSPCPSLAELSVPEDTPIGTTMFSISAETSVGSFPTNNLTLTAESSTTADLVNLTEAVFLTDSTDRWLSYIVLNAVLDRDFEPGHRTLSFRATDSNNNVNTLTCGLYINDVNDNAPTFLGLPYDIEVSEITAVGTILLQRITASDPDLLLGGQVYLEADFSDLSVDKVFNTTKTVEGSGEVMDIVLAEPLDYETRTFYSFNVIARDGGNLNSTAVVRVTVTDVQDTPPFFLLDTYRAAIKENQPVGTPVIRVSAEDGDRDPPNGIIYSITRGRTDYFSINNMTGSITSLVVLDRDNSTMVGSEGVFELIVRATETDDVLPQHGKTTTEVIVVVVVEDVNDHPPTFASTSPYTAFVREDTPLGTLIYFEGDGYISVSDADQGLNSHFNLTVERDGVPWPKLEARPSEVYSEALVLFRVMDSDVFEDSGGSHVSLKLVAREMSTEERYSSTAEVIIAVEKPPEPAPTPAPAKDEGITTPDIIVFVIGFLVIFNVVATVIIMCYVRRKTEVPQQGLARRGSKYYVNGVEKDSKRSSMFLNGSAVSLRSESALVEADGKDRCDVVPLNAVLADGRMPQPASRNGSGSGNDDVADSHSADRGVLIENEVSPAKSAGGSTVTTEVDVNMSEDVSTALATTAVVSSPDDLPDFTMAKRNVSSHQNPAFSLSTPALNSDPNAVTFQPNSAASPTSVVATVATSMTSSPATASVPMEPVTRFSAEGAVSTTTLPAMPGGQPTSAPASVSRATSDDATRAARAVSDGGSMTEILY